MNIINHVVLKLFIKILHVNKWSFHSSTVMKESLLFFFFKNLFHKVHVITLF